MSVEILPGGKIFQDRLSLMKRRVRNFTPALNVIDKFMMTYEKARFKREGPGWAPLVQATKDRKAGLLQPILQRGEPGHTEGLRQSLTSHGPGSLFEITPLTLTMGTSVSYAEYHQKGFSNGSTQVPARPPWPEGDELVALYGVFSAILEAYLVGGAVAAKAAVQ